MSKLKGAVALSDYSVMALFSGGAAGLAFARSSSPAMIRAYSQLAERQQKYIHEKNKEAVALTSK